MALIRCPACNARVSDRAEHCQCGQLIRGAPLEEHQQLHRRRRDRVRRRVKIQMLVAITLFVAGALWIIALNLGATVTSLRAEAAPLALAGIGGVWYLLLRGRLWWLDR